jgi:hypothetical protein
MPGAAAYDDNYGITYFDGLVCDYECGDSSQPYYVTCFSNWVEECSALSAPGFDITVGGFDSHGTSQATAHCSGAAALMFERGGCPLTAWQARSIIYNTAYDIWFAFPYCPLPPPPRHLDALAAVLAVPPWCPGDFNGDRNVDLADLSILIAHFGSSVDRCSNGDLDGDGDVDLADLSVLIARFGTNCD